MRLLSTDLNGPSVVSSGSNHEIGGTPWALGQELLLRGTKSVQDPLVLHTAWRETGNVKYRVYFISLLNK